MDFSKKLVRFKNHITPAQLIALGFIGLILLGTFMLMLPVSSASGHWTSFGDALFTATSSTCVTGLSVVDTGTYWSLFGQIILLILIQIGGMGVITVAVFIIALSGKKIGIMQRSVMQESISAPHIQGIIKLTFFFLKVSLISELAGAVLLSIKFIPRYGWVKGIWFGLFHSISTFCNAGFDLLGIEEQFSSMATFRESPLVVITLCLLILWGGLGFITWDDIRRNKWHFKKYRMQSKVIFTVTAVLLIFPFLYYFFIEFASPSWNLALKDRFLEALFNTITPRTAGFSTIDLSKLSGPGQAVMLFLMLVGGAPGSTAGGMKLTTLAVLYASALAVFKQDEDVHFHGKRIELSAVRNAAAILVMYLTLFLSGGIAISLIEGLSLGECLFETGSAVATVGLSMGITPGLSTASRIILIVLMYLGRVGGLTVIYAAGSAAKYQQSRYPLDTITVG